MVLFVWSTGTHVRLCDRWNEGDDSSQSLACTSIAKVSSMCGRGMYIYNHSLIGSWTSCAVMGPFHGLNLMPNHRFMPWYVKSQWCTMTAPVYFSFCFVGDPWIYQRRGRWLCAQASSHDCHECSARQSCRPRANEKRPLWARHQGRRKNGNLLKGHVHIHSIYWIVYTE